MAKIKILAVISINGRLSMSTGESMWWLNPTKYGIDDWISPSESVIDKCMAMPDFMLQAESSNSVVVIANDNTMKLVNELQEKSLIDELVVFTIPVITGMGVQLFDASNVINYWTVEECIVYPEHITKIVYRRIEESNENL